VREYSPYVTPIETPRLALLLRLAAPKTSSPTRSPPPPSLEGEWSGELIYPSGPPGVALTVSFEPFLTGRTTSGHGIDNNGEFNIQAAQFTYLSTNDYVGVITFFQTYKSRFSGQVWSFMGTVDKDTNRIFGEWHDSPQDGRKRTGKFILRRGSQNVQCVDIFHKGDLRPHT
jgi:hypothetical protein